MKVNRGTTATRATAGAAAASSSSVASSSDPSVPGATRVDGGVAGAARVDGNVAGAARVGEGIAVRGVPHADEGDARAVVDDGRGRAAAAQLAAGRGGAATHGGGRMERSPAMARFAPASFLGKADGPVDAEAVAKATGIVVDDAKAAALDVQVKQVAARIGLDHPCGFARETDFQGFMTFAFVGTVRMWDRKEQTILVGLGALATTADELAPFGKPMKGFEAVHADFLSLSLNEKIEAILVHEHLERGAIHDDRSNPHRVAVEEAPHTELAISPRARKHLELYARVDARVMGPVPW